MTLILNPQPATVTIYTQAKKLRSNVKWYKRELTQTTDFIIFLANVVSKHYHQHTATTIYEGRLPCVDQKVSQLGYKKLTYYIIYTVIF